MILTVLAVTNVGSVEVIVVGSSAGANEVRIGMWLR